MCIINLIIVSVRKANQINSLSLSNGFYLSHVMQENGTGYKIATSVYSAIKDTALEPKLKIVGSDGTAVMTVKSKGFIASLETLMEGSLQ